jgi:tetratricopeptide (TPR) repeat protein
MIKTSSILILALFLMLEGSVFAQSSAESKIKNGKLLAGKALSSQGDIRADYIIKARKEFERANLSDPENALAYYWQAVVTFYLQRDSTTADRLYSKALQYADRKLKAFPSPWAYQTDDNLSAALTGDFAWAKSLAAPAKIAEKPKKTTPSEKPIDPLETLASLIKAENFSSAESLYSLLSGGIDPTKTEELALSGLKLKLAEDSIGQATSVLDNIQKSSNRKSRINKKAVEIYDSALDPAIIRIKRDAQSGEITGAWDALSKWEPERESPVTPGRGKLVLLSASVQLSGGKTTSADSSLALYEALGYDKNQAYQDLQKLLMPVQMEKPREIKIAEKPAAAPPSPLVQKMPQGDNMITVFPPGNEIVKVLVNTIDPISGEVKSTALWETAGPLKLKTGSAYKLVVQKKHEKIAPKYIAVAAMLATFLIVR